MTLENSVKSRRLRQKMLGQSLWLYNSIKMMKKEKLYITIFISKHDQNYI